jgi:hypothetical protein
MSHHGMRDHEEAQESAGISAEAEKTVAPIDIDARALELTKIIVSLDLEIAGKQKGRAELQKELRSIQSKIVTRELRKAAQA